MKSPPANEIIGWREWISLPELGIDRIKVKVDTGARTSALHAENIQVFLLDGQRHVRFDVHPVQRSKKKVIHVQTKLLEKRPVKSSVGTETIRPVVKTTIKIGERTIPLELTLVNRDVMGFRMLLGRQAIKGSYLVDPGRSFLLGN